MYWIDEKNTKLNGTSKQVSFYCDSSSDIVNLPTSKTYGVKQGDDNCSNLPVNKGSSCLCIEDSTLWILNSLDTWIRITIISQLKDLSIIRRYLGI